jgi:hypothetical protein
MLAVEAVTAGVYRHTKNYTTYSAKSFERWKNCFVLVPTFFLFFRMCQRSFNEQKNKAEEKSFLFLFYCVIQLPPHDVDLTAWEKVRERRVHFTAFLCAHSRVEMMVSRTT